MIPGVPWDLFKGIINQAHDLFNKKIITWHRSNQSLDLHNEDYENTTFTDIFLEVLIDYNDFRKWPINVGTETGELDDQAIVILINLSYLDGLGYLNINGNFDFSASEDRFIIDGITYKAWGDTPVSQAYDQPLLEQIILVREEYLTGKPSR